MRMTENRSGCRFKLSSEINCHFTKGHDNGLVSVLDISMKGARILLPKELAKGDILELAFRIPGFICGLQTIGRVIWQAQSDKEDTYFTGIDFVKFPDHYKERLHKYLYDNSNEQVGKIWWGVS